MNRIIRKVILGCLATAAAVGVPSAARSQNAATQPPAMPAPTARPYTTNSPRKPSATTKPPKGEGPIHLEHWMFGGDTYERWIAAASNVKLTLCVARGNIRVNGWKRDEVRVFVKDGSRVTFKVREKSVKDEKAVWISAIGYDPKKAIKHFPDCLWGENIEIDVPENASIEITGQETQTTIDNVRKVWVKNVGGDISIRNIANGVTASTYEGDITIDESEGQMNLETISGNIVAFEVGPGEIGDMFKAKTSSGSITLHSLRHRQTEVNSISGSVFFNGEIRSGGTYSLSTSNGSIRLALPANTACHLGAVYGYGTFASEIPFKIETEDVSPGPLKKIAGKLGTGGDATLKLISNNGSIAIKKN